MKNILKNRKNLLIGIVSICLFIFLLMFYLFHKTSSFNSGDYNIYKVKLETAMSLNVGDTVRISGVSVGKMLSLRLDKDGKVEAVISVNKEYSIPDDSSIAISTSSLISDQKIINIVLGINEEVLENNGTIYNSSNSLSFSDLLDLAKSVIKIDGNER